MADNPNQHGNHPCPQEKEPDCRHAGNLTGLWQYPPIDGKSFLSVKPPYLPERHQSINSSKQLQEQQETARYATGVTRAMILCGYVQANNATTTDFGQRAGTACIPACPDSFQTNCIAFLGKGRERKPVPNENPPLPYGGQTIHFP
jgi:hypothetical protein